MLLMYDPKQLDTLFVVAYLAKAWGLSLTIALSMNEVPESVQNYLAMRVVEANFVTNVAQTEEVLKRAVTEYQADLLIVGREMLLQMNVASWLMPVLLCR